MLRIWFLDDGDDGDDGRSWFLDGTWRLAFGAMALDGAFLAVSGAAATYRPQKIAPKKSVVSSCSATYRQKSKLMHLLWLPTTVKSQHTQLGSALKNGRVAVFQEAGLIPTLNLIYG